MAENSEMSSRSSQSSQLCSQSPHRLSAKYVESFAYKTIRDRLPVILTKAIDTLCRKRRDLVRLGVVSVQFKKEAEEETKEVIGKLAKLRNEMQTNKPIVELIINDSDVKHWNQQLNDYMKENECEALWFEVPWLWAECYMYRRIRQAFQLSKYLSSFDPFQEQKEESLVSSLGAINAISYYLNSLQTNSFDVETEFIKFLELALWGNKCDLSISSGNQNSQFTKHDDDMVLLRDKMVSNQSNQIWNYVNNLAKKLSPIQIDVVLDNSGFELFTDLCLIEFLQFSRLLNDNSVVKFHVKKMGWFVSDTMSKDFYWTLQYLSDDQNSNQSIKTLSSKWINNLKTNKWIIIEHDFWTLPHDFSCMNSVSPDLYNNLSESDLIIFKGDLNYRKLMGDFNWPLTTPLLTALRGFLPSTFCTLRTIKCDFVVGINDQQILERIKSFPDNWMETGEYAVIQIVFK